uniref:C3H1-type domain-containing protein n=1 Tax=Macrostomum lignano TaxID=282301 RepID=A0A1I8H6Y8_9PLAT
MEQSEQEAEADDNISTEAARESAAGLDEDIAKAEKEIRLLQLRKEAAQLKREIGDLQRECPSTRPMNRDPKSLRTPDGEEICLHFNRRGCFRSSCKFRHVCRICFEAHPEANLYAESNMLKALNECRVHKKQLLIL